MVVLLLFDVFFLYVSAKDPSVLFGLDYSQTQSLG